MILQKCSPLEEKAHRQEKQPLRSNLQRLRHPKPDSYNAASVSNHCF